MILATALTVHFRFAAPGRPNWVECEIFHIPPNYVVECVICSSKATRGENLQVEHPICGGYASAFDFHPTLACVLGSTLIRDQVVQVGKPREKRLLAPAWVVKALHGE